MSIVDESKKGTLMSTADDIKVLRQRWDAGKSSGRAGPLDIKRLVAEGHERIDGGSEQRQRRRPSVKGSRRETER